MPPRRAVMIWETGDFPAGITYTGKISRRFLRTPPAGTSVDFPLFDGKTALFRRAEGSLKRSLFASLFAEVFESHLEALLQNKFHLVRDRGGSRQHCAGRYPCPPGEVVGHTSSRNRSGVVRHVNSSATRSQRDHFHMSEIPAGSSAGSFSETLVSEVDQHTAKRRPCRACDLNRSPARIREDFLPVLSVAGFQAFSKA